VLLRGEIAGLVEAIIVAIGLILSLIFVFNTNCGNLTGKPKWVINGKIPLSQ